MEKQLLIVVGSQTGNAERFAHALEQSAKKKGVSCEVHEGNELALDSLPHAGLLTVLTSTFGEGVPPDNFADFFGQLTDPSAKVDAADTAAPFAVFGLGSSSYGDQFCAVAKNVDERLAELGMRRALPLAMADENEDQDAAFDAWSADVLRVFG